MLSGLVAVTIQRLAFSFLTSSLCSVICLQLNCLARHSFFLVYKNGMLGASGGGIELWHGDHLLRLYLSAKKARLNAH